MERKHILITGASGFLGGRMAAYFATKGNLKVTATSRRYKHNPSLDQGEHHFISGDLLDATFCDQITEGVDTVVHCAALSSPWGKMEDFVKANQISTRNLLDAAVRQGVRRFILIATPSIYFNFSDRFDVKETDALPSKMVNAYAHTKLLAEKEVLERNHKGIQTMSLRPRAIIGAEDVVIFPRVIHAYKAGTLKIVGNGNVLCDLTCVRNVIHAAECALNAGVEATGLSYNITNGEPVRLWETVNHVLTSLQMEPVSKHVPARIALGYAGLLEWFFKTFLPKKEPPITRYGIGIMCHSMTMNIDRARNLLGYQPVQTTAEGIEEFLTWYRQQA